MNKLFYVLLFAIILSGCGATSKKLTLEKDSNICIAAIKGTNFLVIEVPAANNFISNKLVAASVKTGGSTAVDVLVKAMSQPTRPPIIVVGHNDDVTAATLEASMLELPAGLKRSSEPVCFAGHVTNKVSLQSAADRAGIALMLATKR